MKKAISVFGFFILVVLWMLITVPPAFSQDMRIGFVDTQAIFQRMPEMRAVEQRLQNFSQRKWEEYITKQQEFQAEYERYQQRLGVISEEAQQAEEERLTELRTELFRLQTQIQQEIQEQEITLMEPLLQQAQQTIDKIAAERGLDYVVYRTAPDGTRVVLYVANHVRGEYDLTDAVMRDMGI